LSDNFISSHLGRNFRLEIILRSWVS
jgi:hypothetical protein